MNNTLLVVGAGPKAFAIHVRARVLRDLGYPSPDVLIIEQDKVGANWAGNTGFTDGKRLLVTAPEKDLGFPYKSVDPRVDSGIAKYSWHAFMVSKRRLAAWVDRNRELQTHSDVAEYLDWVSTESSAKVILGRVPKRGVRLDGEEWVVTYRPKSGLHDETRRVSAIVLTGPGKPRRLVEGQDEHFNISDGKTFWLPVKVRDLATIPEGTIAVIGSGDTAASVIVALLDHLPHPEEVLIHIYCEMGVTFSRGDSLGEVKWSTDPTGWDALPEIGRTEFVRRTERGVFSDVLKSRIDAAHNVHTLPGVVRSARMDGKQVRLIIEDAHGIRSLSDPYKRAIVATGFNRWIFEELFDQRSFGGRLTFPFVKKKKFGDDKWENTKETEISKRILPNLSYEGLERPRIYLPVFAGLKCGPGFPNFGCLGLMSDRIVSSFLSSLRK